MYENRACFSISFCARSEPVVGSRTKAGTPSTPADPVTRAPRRAALNDQVLGVACAMCRVSACCAFGYRSRPALSIVGYASIAVRAFNAIGSTCGNVALCWLLWPLE